MYRRYEECALRIRRIGACASGRSVDSNIYGEKGCETMGTILIVLLILLLIGAVPRWPHSRNWGYYPSGLLGVVLLVIIILALTGRL